MTAFQPYQAYPGAESPVPAGPPPILVAAADPAPQRRWTVLLRFILAVPHLVVLCILSFVAGIIAFLGWWGALFTGRLPEFAVTFLGGFLRWYTRFNAYVCLLTDAYPPFSFDDDPGYPVRVAVPPAQRLNRAAVFFRCILVIPAWFVAAVVGSAFTPIGLIAWLITLVSGRLPRSLHLAYLAVVRYQARLYGYGWLLTPAYPGGLYGDGQATSSWADAPPAAPDFGAAGPDYGTPGYGSPESVYGTPQSPYGTPGPVFDTPAPGYVAPEYVAPGYGVPGGYGVAGGYGQPAFQPVTWLVRLTAGARRWVTAFIVVGALVLVGQTTYDVMRIVNGVHSFAARVDLSQLKTSYADLNHTISAAESATTACDQKLTCVTKQDAKASRGFSTFADQIYNPLLPSGVAADQDRLIADARTLAHDFSLLSKSATVAGYTQTFASIGLQGHLAAFNVDYQTLGSNLEWNYG